jgi:hypothetical protein
MTARDISRTLLAADQMQSNSFSIDDTRPWSPAGAAAVAAQDAAAASGSSSASDGTGGTSTSDNSGAPSIMSCSRESLSRRDTWFHDAYTAACHVQSVSIPWHACRQPAVSTQWLMATASGCILMTARHLLQWRSGAALPAHRAGPAPLAAAAAARSSRPCAMALPASSSRSVAAAASQARGQLQRRRCTRSPCLPPGGGCGHDTQQARNSR